MKLSVIFFATLRDLAGTRRLELELPAEQISVADLKADLSARYPQLSENLAVALVAINEEFSFAQDHVVDGDEVAFFPPVSGGEEAEEPAVWPEIFLLPSEPIDHDAFIASITSPATGAVCLFSGIVRGETSKSGHLPQTLMLEYEAYEPMALAKMRQVAQEIRERWPLVQGIAIAQRIGRLEVGQNTVLIACASGHRDQGCFEAARYGIDRLKEIVPVWKKEVGPSGSTWIEGDYQPRPEDRAT